MHRKASKQNTDRHSTRKVGSWSAAVCCRQYNIMAAVDDTMEDNMHHCNIKSNCSLITLLNVLTYNCISRSLLPVRT